MPSAGERLPSTSSTPSSGRRLISRITSPFASKSRSFGEFTIRVDDPHRQYSPGDVVSGVIDLRVNKPTRITHLVVSLHGFVQVYKNPGAPPPDGHRANNAQLGTGKGSKSGEYFGNGFATLFEDECVLCGDGRLGEGMYKFGFNLEFPDRDLPSSIAFERGTISYMITATITRPVAITPIIQCDHEVFLVERIDISHLYPPKARTITLEPLSRKTRAKAQARRMVDSSDRKGRSQDSQEQASNRRQSETSSSRSLRGDGDPPTSPSPSEVSFESGSYGPVSQSHASNGASTRQSDYSHANGSRISLPRKCITATIESLTGGCLRGDSVPIRVVVHHTKFVKSLYGVIITLYRQARVDMHPAIPIGPTEKGKEAKYEDYYPKSVTGLGGLSLSGAGSSHVFRKDLSQVMLPLVVDPGALTAEVNGKVHVPDEAFPTISTVPGSMISFKYYVEVVVDIQGKLATQDRNMTNLGGFASSMNQMPSSSATIGERSASNMTGTPLLDTASIRRDKGVVSATFEVVVGTKDSERRKGKRKADPSHEQEAKAAQPQEAPVETHVPASNGDHGTQVWQDQGANYGYDGYDYGYAYDPRYYQHQSSWQDFQPGSEGVGDTGFAYHTPAYYEPPVPMPRMEDESQLTEKERMRRAEARLLPSQPPGAESANGEAAGSSSEHGATAPFLVDEQLPLTPSIQMSGTPSSTHRPTTPIPPAQSVPGASHISQQHWTDRGGPGPPLERGLPATDDKKELQRRIMAQEPSAAPTPVMVTVSTSSQLPPEAMVSNNLAPQQADDHTPTAPPLEEVEMGPLYDTSGDSHADAAASSGLPRYER